MPRPLTVSSWQLGANHRGSAIRPAWAHHEWPLCGPVGKWPQHTAQQAQGKAAVGRAARVFSGCTMHNISSAPFAPSKVLLHA